MSQAQVQSADQVVDHLYVMAWIACTQGQYSESPMNPNTGYNITKESKIYKACETKYLSMISKLGGVVPPVDYSALASSNYHYPGKVKPQKEPKAKQAKVPAASTTTNTTGSTTSNTTSNTAPKTKKQTPANNTAPSTNGEVKKKKTINTTPRKVDMTQSIPCATAESSLLQSSSVSCAQQPKLTAEELKWLEDWDKSNELVNPVTGKALQKGKKKWLECDEYAKGLRSRT